MDILPLLEPAIVREIFRLMTHPPIDGYVTYGLARQPNDIILATVAPYSRPPSRGSKVDTNAGHPG
jgi:hypothetical protein